MLETVGAGCPAGKSRMFPAAVDCVTARLIEMAFALDGMPQLPATANVRVCWPCMTGPPMGAPPRVSTTRHGATVKYARPPTVSVSVAELSVGFGSVTPAGAVTVAVLLRPPVADA